MSYVDKYVQSATSPLSLSGSTILWITRMLTMMMVRVDGRRFHDAG